MSKYDEQFYLSQMEESYSSAKEVLNCVLPLLPKISSVIDIGCGVGTWLRAWQEIDNTIKIFGIDGNEVDEKLFYIDKKNYKKVNLLDNYKENLELLNFKEVNEIKMEREGGGIKPFDLVQSLEVAEHLEEKYAKNFIKLLTSFSDIVLFSAAIPHQGGVDHFNEQPPLYWAEIFKEFDYLCFDILRDKMWENKKIAFWYRQNVMFYVHKSKSYIFENLGYKSTQNPLHLVRPELLKVYVDYLKECQEKSERKTLLDIGKFYLRYPKRMFINKKL